MAFSRCLDSRFFSYSGSIGQDPGPNYNPPVFVIKLLIQVKFLRYIMRYISYVCIRLIRNVKKIKALLISYTLTV